MLLSRYPFTVCGLDLTGRNRVVYSGRDLTACERSKAAALRKGWTLTRRMVHDPNAPGPNVAGLARPLPPRRILPAPRCAVRGKDRQDRVLFENLQRMALN
jgi:hypothetical protein